MTNTNENVGTPTISALESAYKKLSEKGLGIAVENAKKSMKKEIYDSCQSLEYESNSAFNSNGQTPFLTFNFGQATSTWGREIQKAILQVRIDGLGKEKRTAVFPKLVFTLKDGVNLKETDPNYDVKQLALECSSKRIYPDILSYDKIVETYGYFVSPMGCVRGYETLTYSDDKGSYIASIESMWDKLSQEFEVKKQDNGKDEYIDVSGIKVLDSHTGVSENVPVVRLVKNYDSDWMKIVTKNANGTPSRILYATTDHPLPVKNKGRVFAEDLEPGDILSRSVVSSLSGDSLYGSRDLAWLAGVVAANGRLHEGPEIMVDYPMYGKESLLERAVEILGKDKVREVVHPRGEFEGFIINDSELREKLAKDFGGSKVRDRTLPAALINAPRAERVSFLTGLIDANGYIDSTTGNVMIDSANKAFVYSQLMLVESLGIQANIRLDNNGGRTSSEASVYSVDFDATKEILSDDVIFDEVEDAIDYDLVVYSADRVFLNEPSYDLTTESDFFDVSGIVSHNCRSFLSKFVNDQGEEIAYGRRNIGVCSLNLPNIALSTDTKEAFMEELDARIQLILKALAYRFDALAKVKPQNAPILYSHGATGHKLGPDDNVQDIFRNGEATASVGYIGLHEVALKFFGEDWQDNPEAKQFTIDILLRMKHWTDLWSEETGVSGSVYSTPAESLTDRFCKMDKAKFGDVPGITDKSYYTNSFHLDVAKKVDPFTKIDFEAVYPPIASGGHIVYVEQPSLVKNLKALEAIWDYGYENVPYMGVNQPISSCLACGYKGDFDADVKGFYCPECENRDPATIEVVERLCGYLSTVSDRKPIYGRIKEMTSRVKHE